MTSPDPKDYQRFLEYFKAADFKSKLLVQHPSSGVKNFLKETLDQVKASEHQPSYHGQDALIPFESLSDPLLHHTPSFETPAGASSTDPVCSDEKADTTHLQASYAVEGLMKDRGVSTQDPYDPAMDSFDASQNQLIDLTSFDGFAYPEQAPTALWPGGRFKTSLPFIPNKKDPNKNVLQEDASHILNLSRQAVLESPWVVRLKYQDYSDDLQLSNAISNEVKWGRTVVLAGHPYKAATVDPQSLRLRFNFSKAQSVSCLDAAKRSQNLKSIHTEMTLQDFCRETRDNSVVRCVLDMPSLDGEKPAFVKFMDDGHTAYNRIHNLFPGRQHMQLDTHKSASWTLLHQGLFFTYPHHDADGYMTWTQILSGYKFWVIIRLRSFDTIQSRNELTGTAANLFGSFSANQDYLGSRCERILIYGGPGDIIIMPPGTFHEVYTPVPSVTLGGHLYSYNTLHLTELCRSIQKQSEGYFTNQDHHSASITIALMMVALLLLPYQELHKKPLLALCDMVINPSTYTFQPLDFDVLLSNYYIMKEELERLRALRGTKGKAKSKKKNPLVNTGIAQSADIAKAYEMAEVLRKHWKVQDPQSDDYIFGGQSFYDPLEVVNWLDAISKIQKR